MQSSSPRVARRAIALLAGVFGIATVLAGGSVALRLGSASEMAGAVVPFVVWFNFAAGFAYLVAAVLISTGRAAARLLAIGIAVATALVAAGFSLAVVTGQPFEMRTFGALGLRVLVWAGIAIWLTRNPPPARA